MKPLVRVAILAAVLLVVSLSWFLYTDFRDSAPTSPDALEFHSKLWKENKKCDREHMIGELVDHRMLTGKSREQVEEMLGPPDGGGTSDLEWRYRIRARKGGSLELHVFFDEDAVIRVQVD